MPYKILKPFISSILIISILFISGCTQQDTQEENDVSPATSPQKESVSIKNFAFDPPTITIKTGTTVTWTNDDSVSHTVTSDGNFDSGTLDRGETFSHTFDEEGTFSYICTIHPRMTGKIIVKD